MNQRHGFQLKVLKIISEFSLRGKWSELVVSMKYLNRIITRFYVETYWKFAFQIVCRKLPSSIEAIPQFIDCLQEMKIQRQNDVIYSFIYLLLSKNLFQLGCDLLKMYHLIAKYQTEQDINTLITSLNGDIQFIKWKQSIIGDINDFDESLAEKCSSHLTLIVSSLDITDCQIKKLCLIYMHYEKVDHLECLLEEYAQTHPNYLNAQKYLYEFYLDQHNKHSLEVFQNLVRLSPSDSWILKYCQKFNDTVMSIDCLFDLLDHFQWKNCFNCWKCLYELILLSGDSDTIKECVKENWSLRKSYWNNYHFKRVNKNKKFDQVNQVKLNVAILFLGFEHLFVKRVIKAYKLKFDNYTYINERYDWLNND